MPIPVDFEKLVKLPAANGYPYSLQSKDLMKNFSWCDLLPSSEDDLIRIEFDEVLGVTQQHNQRRIKVVGGLIIHPFHVKYDGSSNTYEVIGGDCGGIEISDQTITSVAPEFLYVKIERNTSSRVVIAATLEQGSPLPTSTEEFQYIAIAYLDGPAVTQLRFEDIRLTEFLISDAGELKLVSVFDTTNTYALP